MLDVCSSCRIQAPHRDGRTACPRCGGPLVVTDERGAVALVTSGPHAARPRPHAGPVPQNPVPQNPAAQNPVRQNPAARNPVPSRQQAPVRRSVPRPMLRWVADRPREAMPVRRGSRRAPAGPTPRYAVPPNWGLIDVPVGAVGEVDDVPVATDAVRRATWFASLVLAATALVHGIRYVIAVVNRTRPLPAWLDLLSSAATLVFGVMALVAVALATVAFGRWVSAFRRRSYRSAGHVDPRHRILVFALSVTPLVSAVGAPWMVWEAVRAAPDVRPRSRRVMARLAVAWGIVNAIAILAFVYRLAGMATDSLQVRADGLAVVTLSFAVSAIFAFWASPRFDRVVGRFDDETSLSRRRLVAA